VRLAQGDVAAALESYQQALVGGAPGDTITQRAHEKINALGKADAPSPARRTINNEVYASLAVHRQYRFAGSLPPRARVVPARIRSPSWRRRAPVRSGDFGKALIAFRRLTYELARASPRMADVR